MVDMMDERTLEAALRVALGEFVQRAKVTHPTTARAALDQEWNRTLTYVLNSPLAPALATLVLDLWAQERARLADGLDEVSNQHQEQERVKFMKTGSARPDRWRQADRLEHAFSCGWDWAIETVRAWLEGKG